MPWLVENYGCEVICFCANLGQEEELSGLEAKAIASGASKLYIEDLREEFVTDYIYPDAAWPARSTSASTCWAPALPAR